MSDPTVETDAARRSRVTTGRIAASHVGTVVRRALDASVQRLLVADPIARAGEDPEGVHQARVATRRLRSDLKTYGPLLDEQWAEGLRSELRWLGQELGIARDAEVLSGYLTERARELPADVARAVEPTVRAALGDQDAAHARILGVLHSARYLDLVDRLVQAAMAPRLSPAAERASTRDLARLARAPYRKLVRAHKALGRDPADAELHALRIRAKRARYAVEAIADAVGGSRPHELGAALAALQDVLGEHQDAVVAQAWLHAHVARGGPDDIETAYATGMLAGLLRADARAARAAYPDAWRAAHRRRLRTWM